MVSRGTCGQRGFPEFSLTGKLNGNANIVAVNPASPLYRSLALLKQMENRQNIISLIDIPNVGKATVKYLNFVGIKSPFELIGQNPYWMFEELCTVTGKQFDPCLADVFISAVKYMEGEPERKWWYYTEERKKKLVSQKNKL